MLSLLSAVPTESDDPQGVWVLDIHWEHRRSPWQPPTDVFENETFVIVRVEIAGMNPENFQLKVEGQTLLISGYRDDPDFGTAYHRLEIPFGRFQVILPLPASIETDHIKAEYHDGFLRIYLPKRAPRNVPIQHLP